MMDAYQSEGSSKEESEARTSMDLGHGDGRGRYVRWVYAAAASPAPNSPGIKVDLRLPVRAIGWRDEAKQSILEMYVAGADRGYRAVDRFASWFVGGAAAGVGILLQTWQGRVVCGLYARTKMPSWD